MSERNNPDNVGGDTTSQDEPDSHPINDPFKILGETDQGGGHGVLGINTAGSGTGNGVEGRTETSNPGAAGVLGFAPATHGVFGKTGDSTSNAVYGIATASTGYAHGVRGDTSSDQGIGVWGNATASSGTTYGVYGSTDSGDGYGVYSDGDAEVTGDLTVQGDLKQATGGAEVYLGSNQSVSGGADTTVAFDQVVTDQRSEFDPGTNEYTCAYDGNYHVDASIKWEDPSVDAYLMTDIVVNGTSVGNEYLRVGSAGFQSMNNSKTLFDLSANDTISIVVWADRTSALSGSTSDPRIYTSLTINQVG